MTTQTNIPASQYMSDGRKLVAEENNSNLVSIPKGYRQEKNDAINHPLHYIGGRKYEPIAVIEDWKLPYHLGSALKYISRAGRKEPTKTCEDLRKACWYLNRYINQIEREKEC